MIITRPTMMQLRDWTDQVILDLDAYGTFGKLLDDAAWQDWALQFFNNAAIGRNLPDPYSHDDWRAWAELFCGTLD